MCFVSCPGYDGAQIVPRFATYVYFNCVTGDVSNIPAFGSLLRYIVHDFRGVFCPRTRDNRKIALSIRGPVYRFHRKPRRLGLLLPSPSLSDALRFVLSDTPVLSPFSSLQPQCLVKENEYIRRFVCECSPLDPNIADYVSRHAYAR